jgi:uncharacterized membrane protein
MQKTLKETRTLVMLGLMLAITMILDLTPLGAIPMGTVVATIAHLPTILVGITLGPVAGLISGIAFGFVSFFHALLRPASAFSLLFINPLISIIPRMFIGVTAYYAYSGARKLIGNKGRSLAIGIGAAVGSLTNTVLVLLALTIIYGGKIESMLTEAGLTTKAMAWAIGVAGTNGIIEAVISVILITAIGSVYFKQFKS